MRKLIFCLAFLGALAWYVVRSIDQAMQSSSADRLRGNAIPVCDSLGRFEQFNCVDTFTARTRQP